MQFTNKLVKSIKRKIFEKLPDGLRLSLMAGLTNQLITFIYMERFLVISTMGLSVFY